MATNTSGGTFKNGMWNKTRPETIVLVHSFDLVKDGNAVVGSSETSILAGHLVNRVAVTTSNSYGKNAYSKAQNAAALVSNISNKCIAIENDRAGKSITGTAYKNGETMQVFYLNTGDEVQCRLVGGTDGSVSEGDVVYQASNGRISDNKAGEFFGYAMETLDNSAADADSAGVLIKVEVA